jgi:hypothetical protein
MEIARDMIAATADSSMVDGLTRAERVRRVRRLARLADLLDTAVRLPGTNVRFGLDSILGILPVGGDAAAGALGLYIVNEARRLGLPRRKLVRMLANIGTDFAVGSVPLAGDLFDVFFKAHRRNIEIVLAHFRDIDLDDVADVHPHPDKVIEITPVRR